MWVQTILMSYLFRAGEWFWTHYQVKGLAEGRPLSTLIQKSLFFNEVSVSAGFILELCCSISFPLSVSSTLVQHVCWSQQQMAMDRTKQYCSGRNYTVCAVFCRPSALCLKYHTMTVFPGAGHTNPGWGSIKELVPYQAFAFPVLNWNCWAMHHPGWDRRRAAVPWPPGWAALQLP